MPRTKKPKCTYATLSGRDRTAAFKKHIKKMMNGGKKTVKKKRVIGPNHVSQIMKRRAAKARAEKRASEEVWAAVAERKAREEAAEKFNRIFFGTTPQMEYEMAKEAELQKMRKEREEKIRNMTLQEYIKDRSQYAPLARGFARRANVIRLAWKLKKRRLTKKRNRRVHWCDTQEIVEYINKHSEYFNISKIIK